MFFSRNFLILTDIFVLLNGISAVKVHEALDLTISRDDIFFSDNECNWSINDTSTLCIDAGLRAIENLVHFITISSTENKLAFNPLNESSHHIPPMCVKKKFGHLYGSKTPDGCVFYSIGIEKDWTFDYDLSESKNCRGFMLDPSVSYPAIISDKLTFFALGLNVLELTNSTIYKTQQTLVMRPTTNRTLPYMGYPSQFITTKTNSQGKPIWNKPAFRTVQSTRSWIITSLPRFKLMMNHKHIDALKVDCEGCEYAIARDISREDPRFLKSVDQFELEVHLSSLILKSDEHLHYLGLLLHMLFKEKFWLINYSIGGCNPRVEARHPLIESMKRIWKRSSDFCHTYTFAKL